MTDDISSAPLKATLKAGPGYEAPWISVEADNPEQLKEYLYGLHNTGAFVTLVEAASRLRTAHTGVVTAEIQLGAQTHNESQQQQPKTNGWGQQQSGGQQQPSAGNSNQPAAGNKLPNDQVSKGGHYPPAGPRPTCAHGQRDWKSFISKKGKLTEMWTCPFDRQGAFIPEGESKCDVQWFDREDAA